MSQNCDALKQVLAKKIYIINGVGLDSKKRFFSEKLRKEGKRGGKMGKEAIRYRKSAHDIIKFNYFIGIRILQWFVINDYATENCFCKIRVLGVQPTGY